MLKRPQTEKKQHEKRQQCENDRKIKLETPDQEETTERIQFEQT